MCTAASLGARIKARAPPVYSPRVGLASRSLILRGGLGRCGLEAAAPRGALNVLSRLGRPKMWPPLRPVTRAEEYTLTRRRNLPPRPHPPALGPRVYGYRLRRALRGRLLMHANGGALGPAARCAAPSAPPLSSA